MGDFSIWHWLVVIAFITIPIPIGRLLTMHGRHWAWSLLCFVPVLNIVFLWVWAFSKSPQK